MTASVARQIVLAARPNGKPKLTDFRLEETEIQRRLPGSFCSRCSTCRLILICAAEWMTESHTPRRSSSATRWLAKR
jgi:hypothetical protein